MYIYVRALLKDSSSLNILTKTSKLAAVFSNYLNNQVMTKKNPHKFPFS